MFYASVLQAFSQILNKNFVTAADCGYQTKKLKNVACMDALWYNPWSNLHHFALERGTP